MEIRTKICFLAAVFLLTAYVATVTTCQTSDALAMEIEIVLSDGGVTVDGSIASTDSNSSVYVGAEIVYYEDGTNSSYGAGSSSDMHSKIEASKHTVVSITQAGTYHISGTLSYGQIAVDVGSSSSDVVTLILDGVKITCTVAPAIIFYNVWESGDLSVSTTDIPDVAGANIIIADGSVNDISGSYVAKIYKTGTTSKLHKYDGAVYSKMSMIISGGSTGSGILNIYAENEGLDSELHLTINGGTINIEAQNDGINTNEDGISVTEINGGTIFVNAGLGSEGDGIDSNGYLIINGGTIVSMANPQSGDGGIDADLSILINGGTVVAFGSRNDSVSTNSSQNYMELTYSSTQSANTIICIKDTSGNVLLVCSPSKSYQSFTFSSSELKLGTVYNLYSGGVSTGILTNCIYSGGSYSGGSLMQYSGNFSTMQPGNQFRPGNGDFSSGSTSFTITSSIHSFSGVSVSSVQSSKTAVTISVAGLFESQIVDSIVIESIIVTYSNSVLDISQYVQVTVQDSPSEDYYESVMLSKGIDAVNGIMPTSIGTYVITIAILDSCEQYSGVYQYTFNIVDGSAEEDTDQYGINEDLMLYLVGIIVIVGIVFGYVVYRRGV